MNNNKKIIFINCCIFRYYNFGQVRLDRRMGDHFSKFFFGYPIILLSIAREIYI